MARYVAVIDGNYSTTTVWETVTNTPTINTGVTTVLTLSNSASFTATFTAPNTTNKCTGVAILISRSVGTTGTLTLTLQESTVDTTATVTVNLSDCRLGWNYFRFASPYTFTTTGAGAYRFKLLGAGTTPSYQVATDNGGSNAVYMATIDTNPGAAPTTGDSCLVANTPGSGTRTVTITGTGNLVGVQQNNVQTARIVNYGIMVGAYGLLKFDPTANASISTQGHIYVTCGGEIQLQPNAGVVHTITLDQNGTSGAVGWGVIQTGGSSETAAGIGLAQYQSYSGKITCNPTLPTYIKTTYSSGLGTAVSPLVTADPVNWSVGDEIIVAASSNNATNYNESEKKFIRTVVSTTQFTLAASSGGAESGLSNTHAAGSRIIHMTRPIIVTTNNAAQYGFTNVSGCLQTSTAVVKGIQFSNCGTGTGRGVVSVTGTGGIATVDYCTAENINSIGFAIDSGTATSNNWTNNFAYNNTGNGSGAGVGSFSISTSGASMTDCISILTSRLTFNMSNAGTFTRCEGIAANTGGFSSGGGAAFYLTGANGATFNSCQVHASRIGIQITISSNFIWTSLVAGTLGYNSTDIAVDSGAFASGLFDSSTFSSTSFFTSYLTMAPGSELRFHRYQNTDNKHRWYTAYGEAQSTGSGLEDTLVRTPGSLNVRVAPEDSTTGFTWSFQIPASKNTTVNFQGFFQKNAAFGSSTATVNLFLPGTSLSGAPDATTTLSNTTGSYLSAAVSAYYSGNYDGLATVTIVGQTTTSSAYLYIADLYNSGDTTTLFDKLAGLTIWYQGKPSSVITQINLGGVPSAVWAVATSGLTAAGTTGKQQKDVLTLPKFIGLK